MSDQPDHLGGARLAWHARSPQDRVLDDPRSNPNTFAAMRRIIGSRELAALRTSVKVECY